jgi:hypothetical protein
MADVERETPRPVAWVQERVPRSVPVGRMNSTGPGLAPGLHHAAGTGGMGGG